jgi:hypothetical protein
MSTEQILAALVAQANQIGALNAMLEQASRQIAALQSELAQLRSPDAAS